MSRGDGDPGTHPQQVWESISSVRSEPCVIGAGNSVFTVATPAADFGAQRLFRVDTATGEVIWSSQTFETDLASSCPATDGSRVYLARGAHLTALEVADGAQAWDVDLGGDIGMPVVSEGTVYVGSKVGKGMLFARDASNGEAVWSAEATPTRSAPIVAGDNVVNLAKDGSPTLSAFDAETGAPRWSSEETLVDAIGRGDALIYSTGATVVARDESGTVSWTYTPPPFTSVKKLVADGPYVHALAPATDFLFQVNHLVRLFVGSGEVSYSREFDKVTNCCGTTAAYAPFVKLGDTLYNHYRYFDAATGESPGGPFDRTQTIFYDGESCANEQDSMFAHMGRTVYVWKHNCSTARLVARRDAQPPDPFKLLSPANGQATEEKRPDLIWEKAVDSGGTGVSHFELTLDGESLGGEIPPSQTAWELDEDLAEGSHTWSVDAVDEVGNRRSAGPATFTVDTEPPTPFELVSPADGASNLSPDPVFSWNAAVDPGGGVDHYQLWIDETKQGALSGKSCGEGLCSFDPGIALADGGHTWHVLAIDTVGNVRQSATRTFTVDATPPAPFGLIAPPHLGFAGARPTFQWQASSDGGAGLDRYELTIDKAVVEVPAGTESFTPAADLLEGPHSWFVTAVDKAGNRRQAEPRTFDVDLKAPSPFALLAPQNDEVTGARPELRWKGTDDVGKAGLDRYEVFVDGEEIGESPAGIEAFTPSEDLAEGAHTWFVAAVDKAGNRRETEARGFSVDSAPPAPFELIEPADGAVTPPRPLFQWEKAVDQGVSGLDRYELFVDGKLLKALSPSNESFAPGEDLAEGAHTWFVAAVDNAGNRRDSETRSFTVDGAPPAPFELIEPADGAATTARPQLGWEEAVDQGIAGLDRYEVFIDGSQTDVLAGTESFVPEEDLSPGFHFWSVTAVDKVGNRRDSETRGFIVASPPSAAFVESPVLALTGTPVTLDASASSAPPGGEITKYEWDLDGDGIFERDTGAQPTTSQTYMTVGDVSVAVRVSSNLSTSSTANGQVSVRPAPPAGHLGVTINEGDEFTNKRKVTISAVWPVFALTALVSNDGGFGAASTFPLGQSISWKLDSAGAERLPKTIYVRFEGGTAGRETYQDDIILDLVKPKVLAAGVSPGALLSVRARDTVSGVKAVQVSNGTGSSGPWRPFGRRVRLARRGGRVMVRVRDRAGNVSRWRRAMRR